MNRNKPIIIAVALVVTISAVGSMLWAARKTRVPRDSEIGPNQEFYVYKNRGERLNHYIPSGWMGDYGDIKVNQAWKEGVKKPKKKSDEKATKEEKKSKDTEMAKDTKTKVDTAIKISYSAERKQGAGWSGVYWQHPANNWGDKRGGFDLTKYTKLVFYAKGETGEEVIDKLFMGGITGQTEEGDSDEASISPVELSTKWEEYIIGLEGLDLSHIIGGFGFALNSDANPDGATFYLDEIRYEK